MSEDKLIRKRNIWSLLSQLKASEQDAFLRWLLFRYPSKEHDFYKLSQAIIEDTRKRESATLEEIWYLVYPDLPFNSNKLTRLCSRAFAELERYIAYLQLDKDPYMIDRLLLEAYNARSLIDLFPKAWNKAYKALQKQKIRDAWYLEHMAKIHGIHAEFSGRYPKLGLKNRVFEFFKYLDLYFFHKKKEMDLVVRSMPPKLVETNYRPYTIEISDNHAINEDKVLILLEEIYNLSDPSLEVIRLYFERFKQYHNFFHASAKINVFVRLANLITSLVREQRDIDTASLYIEMEDWALETKVFFVNGYLRTQNTVRNLLMVNLRYVKLLPEKEQENYFKYIEVRFNKITNHLHPMFIENARKYILAELAFAKGDYNEGFEQLKFIDTFQSFYARHARILYIMLIYESEGHENQSRTLTYLDALRQLLSNKKEFSKAQSKTGLAFVNLLTRLINLTENRRFNLLDRLHVDIKDSNAYRKEWLLDKCQEAIGNFEN